MIQNWVDDRRSSAEINNEIQSMNNIKAEIWGTRIKPSNPGFDQDIPNASLIGTCMVRLDLWKGTLKSEPDLVGKVGSTVDIWKGDHLKFTTDGETGSRGIDDSPVGKDWDLVVQNVRIFGKTKELELKYA